MRRPSGSRYRQRSFKQPLTPLIPQDRTLSPEIIHNTAHGIAKRAALLPPLQDLHKALKQAARLPRVGRLPPTPGLIARRVRLLVLTTRVVAGSFPLILGVIELPNSRNDRLKEIRPERPPTCPWPLQFLTSRSAETSMAMCPLKRQMLNLLFHRPHRPHCLISLLHYR